METDEVKKESPLPSGIADMLLGRSSDKILDAGSMIHATQERISKSLKQGFEYDHSGWIVEASDFLRKHVNSKPSLVILFVDLVGSTKMSLELPDDKVAVIISSFSQEMGYVIKYHNGYLLKYVGDAIIGFFVGQENAIQIADKAINCAKSMITVIDKGINPILNKYDYPKLSVKVGIDFGKNNVIRYGSDKQRSHVDILGSPMNIAAKIMSHAKPNQILIGQYVYEKLHPSLKSQFVQVSLSQDQWKYLDRETKEPYKVYSLKN